MTQKTKYLLYALAGIQFTNIVDFMIIMPLAPMLEHDLGISDDAFAWLVSVYAFSSGLTGIAATFFINKLPRKTMLILVYAIFTAATVVCGIANDHITLMTGRVLVGVGGGLLTILINTIVAEQVAYEERGRAMGMVMAAFSVASVLGVPVGLLLANHFESWRSPFFLLAGLSVGIGVITYYILRNISLLHTVTHTEKNLQNLWAVISMPKHWLAYAFIAGSMFSSFIVIPYITLYSTTNMGITLAQVPWIYFIGGACTFFSLQYIGRWSDQYGKHRLYIILTSVSIVVILALTHVPAVPLMGWLFISSCFFIFISGRMVPAMALTSEVPPLILRGHFMSLLQSVLSLAQGCATLLGGYIIARDSTTGLLLHYDIVGWVSTMFAAMAIVLANFLQIKPTQKSI